VGRVWKRMRVAARGLMRIPENASTVCSTISLSNLFIIISQRFSGAASI
jgi:hypothetical protein